MRDPWLTAQVQEMERQEITTREAAEASNAATCAMKKARSAVEKAHLHGRGDGGISHSLLKVPER
ncbi:hypothetical protein Esi_0153_0003 [Ectocarpus siliculosus]|uniref:Uncharacterized protein n=1 Tax=Ectocarpus siliculosus TaxID=2880 RepID=D7FL24_ECTSI|nr:hypothetical protein Esi_0153_0003 [Ectocarpus siliculosus]|eukprot:CBJ29561.1 hypothetical protein Esi_0153_0003 [Ectocarpus siliculosus]